MKQSGSHISAQNDATDELFVDIKDALAEDATIHIRFLDGTPYLESDIGTIQTLEDYTSLNWIQAVSDGGVFNSRQEIKFDPHFIDGYNQIHDATIEVRGLPGTSGFYFTPEEKKKFDSCRNKN